MQMIDLPLNAPTGNIPDNQRQNDDARHIVNPHPGIADNDHPGIGSDIEGNRR
ncbi:hypothetical protein D3C71_2038510 [compost metagenome]